MSKWVDLALAAALAATPLLAGPAQADKMGLGRAALPAEIAAWDHTVLPDGTGLPPGSGTVDEGDKVFSEKCSACHGDFAEGLDNWPTLAGGMNTLTNRRPVKTIGSYWPHLSTVFDYIHRSMPFGNAQTLSVDQTYAIVAFLLYSNGIVDENFKLTQDNFTSIKMPNADGFRPDDRPQVEYPKFSQTPCMTNCKDKVEITKRAVKLNVTPKEDGKPAGTLPDLHIADAGMDSADASSSDASAGATDTAAADAAPAASGPDPELVATGKKLFRKCMACHRIGPGAKNAVGPELNGVVGRPVASIDGFNYSSAMKALGSSGQHWTADKLKEFLSDPRKTVKGTKMGFGGFHKPEELDAIVAYLSSVPAQ